MGTKPVIDKEKTETIVFDYKPKEFPVRLTNAAESFVATQGETSSGFRVSPIVAEQAGIADLNRQKVEQRVEQQALEKLKEVEERAYQEAYNLGLDEGRQKAFEEHSVELKTRIENLEVLLSGFDNIKEHLMDQNESQLIHLVHIVAKKIAMREVEVNKEIILDVISEVLREAQSDEDVQIYISQNDFDFIKRVKKAQNAELNQLKNVKFEIKEGIESGGCILESKFGSIDATVNQRVDKAWDTLQGKAPRIKNKTDKSTDENSDESDDT